MIRLRMVLFFHPNPVKTMHLNAVETISFLLQIGWYDLHFLRNLREFTSTIEKKEEKVLKRFGRIADRCEDLCATPHRRVFLPRCYSVLAVSLTFAH